MRRFVSYLASLDWARQQQAKSWELRTSTSLADLWQPGQAQTGAYTAGTSLQVVHRRVRGVGAHIVRRCRAEPTDRAVGGADGGRAYQRRQVQGIASESAGRFHRHRRWQYARTLTTSCVRRRVPPASKSAQPRCSCWSAARPACSMKERRQRRRNPQSRATSSSRIVAAWSCPRSIGA
jgi:hypothetical protein